MRTVEEIKKEILDIFGPNIDNLISEFEKAIYTEYDNTAYNLLKKSLTFAEEDALNAIINKIHTEGIISINALSKETGISRPVFNNLINKLENAQMVTINNMGAKGTYIKFLNKKLLQERKV